MCAICSYQAITNLQVIAQDHFITMCYFPDQIFLGTPYAIKPETSLEINSYPTLLCLIVGGDAIKRGVAEISNFDKMGGSI